MRIFWDDRPRNLSYKEQFIKSINDIFDALFSVNVISSIENLNNFKNLTEVVIDSAENWYNDIQAENRRQLIEDLINEQSKRFGLIDRQKEY